MIAQEDNKKGHLAGVPIINEKRPLRAERPVLPRPGAAVLSARRGLTAEFGMGSGDPPLHGSAREGRSHSCTLASACARTSLSRTGNLEWILRSREISANRRARAISNARLRRSRALQLRPIDLVVCQGPYRKGDRSWGRLPA